MFRQVRRFSVRASRVVALGLVTISASVAASPTAQDLGLAGSAGSVEHAALSADARDGLDLLEFCTSNTDKCAISVYDLGAKREGHLFPDRPQVLASTSKILYLLGYAQAVADGAIDPDDEMSRNEWARYLTLDGFALRNSWIELGSPQNVSWNDLARMMIRFSDNATPDHLDKELGKKRIKNARKLFKGFHDIPLPISTMIGLWVNGTGVGGDSSRIADSYGSIGTAGFRSEAKALFNALGTDAGLSTYRRSLCVEPPWGGADGCDRPQPQPTVAERQFQSRYQFTRSTTRTYMKLMAALLQDEILTKAERDILTPILEIWLDAFPTLMPAFSRYGLKGGSLSASAAGLDILTWAHYMRASGNDYVAVVFLQAISGVKNAPEASDVNSFAQQFALSPNFRETVLSELADADDRTELVPEILKAKASGRFANITVKVRAENASPNEADPFVVRLYLSDDNQLDAGDQLLDEANYKKLKAYKGKNTKLSAKPPGSAKGKYLIVAVDDDADNAEQDEDNNILWQRVR